MDSTKTYLVIDLEATCDDQGGVPRAEMEIIEIGAVLVAADTLAPVNEWQSFVRPVRHPTLTAFCTKLTSITQAQVDAAPAFADALTSLSDWYGRAGEFPMTFCSWGDYDRHQFKQDCAHHGIDYPLPGTHLNVKRAFSTALGTKRKFGMAGALKKVGLPLEGTHHRGIDDARNIAKLFFAQHAPASFEHFVNWSGLTKTAAKAAVAELGLREVEVEGPEGTFTDMLATKAALDAANAKGKPKGEAILGLQDLYLVVRGGPASVCPAAHLDVDIPRWGPMRGGPIRGTKHPHLRAVLVAGELAGFWEVNAAMDEQHIAWLETPGKAAAGRAEKKVKALREFMRDELGHAKTFSIDSDPKIDKRFALVQGLG